MQIHFTNGACQEFIFGGIIVLRLFKWPLIFFIVSEAEAEIVCLYEFITASPFLQCIGLDSPT